MIRYYVKVLLSGIIKKLNQPLLYMIAIHHLNGFLFDQTRMEQFNLQRTIMKNLQSVSINEKVKFFLGERLLKLSLFFCLDLI